MSNEAATTATEPRTGLLTWTNGEAWYWRDAGYGSVRVYRDPSSTRASYRGPENALLVAVPASRSEVERWHRSGCFFLGNSHGLDWDSTFPPRLPRGVRAAVRSLQKARVTAVFRGRP